ncbi:ABC transporter ATP-binding protein [Caenispirillum bisanense]|uniref:ABC transporter ATP-binding protein n=1 Tax=Caenispirillum bisanense TaxID=414052 RepID=UPI0031D17721
MSAGFVELDRVRLRYRDGDDLALEQTTMSIREGEFVAVVGPSGCGKSSLMKLVTGLMPPTEGNIIVDGHEVTGPISIVGMAFQASTLLPWRTTLENVMLPLEIVQPHRSRLRRHRAEYEARARALLAEVGLTGFEDKHPWELSGGMQQRANLCRALIHEPRLLMLDEPFGALDAFTREELWDTLQALWMEHRFTVILVTHDLREAAYLADTIYVMSKRPGRILVRRENDIARPRTQDTSFTPPFVELVHELRDQIRTVRAT